MDFNDFSTSIGKFKIGGVDSDKRLCEKNFTFSEALFHELCHAFHKVTGLLKATDINKSVTLSHVYSSTSTKYLWGNDEELYNMTGVFYNGTSLIYDPICCNMFDMCNSLKIGEPIVQRMFHCSYDDFQSIVNICNIESLTVLETIIKGHESFDIFTKIYKTYGTKPNFMLDTDKFLVDTSPYILTKS
jgi:hypothetical protein